jgi:hypothetical protein
LGAAVHTLLGRPIGDLAQLPDDHIWQLDLDATTLPYLQDHHVADMAVAPLSLFVELARAAGREVFRRPACAVRELRLHKPLFVGATGPHSAVRGSPATAVVVLRVEPARQRAAVPLDAARHRDGRRRGGCRRRCDGGHAMSPAASLDGRDLQFSLMFFACTEEVLRGTGYRLVIESARFADREGFTAVWVPERHFTGFGYLYRTRRSTLPLARGPIASGCAPGRRRPLHHPLPRRGWAMVDNLSGGRLTSRSRPAGTRTTSLSSRTATRSDASTCTSV